MPSIVGACKIVWGPDDKPIGAVSFLGGRCVIEVQERYYQNVANAFPDAWAAMFWKDTERAEELAGHGTAPYCSDDKTFGSLANFPYTIATQVLSSARSDYLKACYGKGAKGKGKSKEGKSSPSGAASSGKGRGGGGGGGKPGKGKGGRGTGASADRSDAADAYSQSEYARDARSRVRQLF